MKAHDALAYFQTFLSENGAALEVLLPQTAVELMVRFYAQVRADDCAFDEDGDMLLFQWGVYNWGNGEFFEYNITRQFIMSEAVEQEECADDWIGQLSLTLKYQPFPVLKTIAAGNLWCAHPDDIPGFLTFIQACDATMSLTDLPIVARELTFINAE